MRSGTRFHFADKFASTIWIRIGPDQSHVGHDKIPVVIALNSISARFITCPHFGQICALTSLFPESIQGNSVQYCNRSVGCVQHDARLAQ
jgi:hypothetical protein